MGRVIFQPLPTGPSTISKRLAYTLSIIDSPVGIDQLDEHTNILVYPNPAENRQIIEPDFAVRNKIEIDLFDIQGKRIQMVYPSQELIGQLKIENDISHLSPRMCIYRFTINDRFWYTKFVKH